MATKAKKSKKSRDWLDEQADEINEAFADELSKLTEEDIPRLTGRTSKASWPKVVIGSHLTVYTYENGRTELEWDDEALLKDVQNAILKFESNISAKSPTGLTEAKKSAKVSEVKTSKRKKKNES